MPYRPLALTTLVAALPRNAQFALENLITRPGSWPSLSSFALSLTLALAAPAQAAVVISQVYGGGGNSGALYKNDFIELYNAGTGTVDLSNYAVQYASATSSNWSETLLTGSLAPGQHYLIAEAQGAGGTQNLPTPQATGTINLAATSGKLALTKTQTLLTVDNPIGNSNLVDFIGFGSADAYEGAGAAPTLSNTTSALRANSGATDTNNNSADFSAGAPNPRNN
jgi:predicted extracellular nuclease